MKILILHQPFPMGNYKLMPYIAQHLSKLGNDVYLLEQLNGRVATDEYTLQLKSHEFDCIYYEMLDSETFNLISQLTNVNKVLCYTSRGIFDNFDDILSYSGKLYNKVLTNSNIMYQKFVKNAIECEHFQYYPAPIDFKDIESDDRYKFDFVYLGGGFHRLTNSGYELEREIIYNNPVVHKFGSGYINVPNYKGLLPPNDIGRLYHNANFSLATIEPEQRSMGMINNRYSEIMKSGGRILSLEYNNIDFFGAEDFINFTKTSDIKNQIYKKVNLDAQKKYILEQENVFFSKLLSLL